MMLFIAFPIVGFFLGMKYQETMDLTKSQQEESSLVIPRAPTPVDETANWKTYTNNKFGYSFKYPPILSVSNCPNYQCGEIIFYPKSPNKLEINVDNRLVMINLIGGKYCQDENKFKDYTNFKRASQQAQCSIPGVHNVDDSILPVTDEQTTNVSGGLSQYSFYLQGRQNFKIGPFYAFFFSKPITETNINNDLVTYYGAYWTPNQDKPLTPDKMSTLDQILSTFKFTP
jgi:hypothetical protein